MILNSENAEVNIFLRPLKDTDAHALAQLANNKKIWDNVRDLLPHPYTLKDAEFFVGLTQKEEIPQTFAIFHNDEFCGMTGLHIQNDVYRLSAELGYWIGEPYWGRGIASHAVKIITNYGFEKLGMERIYAGIFEFNVGSMRVLEKNGFQKEGVFRKAVLKNGKMWDEHRYGKVKG
ncbi:MAG: GNAT family protein [Bacteroidota bacterium]